MTAESLTATESNVLALQGQHFRLSHVFNNKTFHFHVPFPIFPFTFPLPTIVAKSMEHQHEDKIIDSNGVQRTCFARSTISSIANNKTSTSHFPLPPALLLLPLLWSRSIEHTSTRRQINHESQVTTEFQRWSTQRASQSVDFYDFVYQTSPTSAISHYTVQQYHVHRSLFPWA